MNKHSIRYFLDKPIRAVWDVELNKWWYSATDVIRVITQSSNPRVYWNVLKKRHIELSTFCKQLKMFASDDKKYLTDVIDEQGIKRLSFFIREPENQSFQSWLQGSLDPIDEQSKRKAYSFFHTHFIEKDEIGKTIALKKIHSYLFEGLYPFAGQIRTKTISKDGFVFANGDFLPQTLNDIDAMKDFTFDDIVEKYIAMNIAHPFMDGNGRATRIWLDSILIENLQLCVDWSLIEKSDYLKAMKESPISSRRIYSLLKNALKKDIKNRELFLKGIDSSYYYEEIE